DRQPFGHGRRQVAAAALHVEVNGERGVLAVQRGQVLVRVDDLVVRGRLDHAGGDLAVTGRLQEEAGRTVGEGAQAHLLEVQEELRHVLFHAGDGRELVLHALDTDGRDRSALQGGQQHTTQRVAQRRTEARLERLGDEVDVVPLLGFDADLG